MIIFTCFAVVFTACRLVVRSRTKLGWDDFFAVIATIAIMSQAIMMNLRIRGVASEHAFFLPCHRNSYENSLQKAKCYH
jgi:hypothetical protein